MYTLITGPIQNKVWLEVARRIARQEFPHNGLLIRGADRVRTDELLRHVTAALVDEAHEGVIELLQGHREIEGLGAQALEIQELIEGGPAPTDEDPDARAVLVMLAVPVVETNEDASGDEVGEEEMEEEVVTETDEDAPNEDASF